MTFSLVADTSFLFKLAFPNPHVRDAEKVCEKYNLFAPAFTQVELSNALWKAVKFGGLAALQAHSALEQLVSLYRPIADEDLVANALDLAMRMGHPVYDCMFITLAADMAVPLITADRKLISALSANDAGLACYDIASLPDNVLN